MTVPAVVAIPIRSFSDAKTRLSAVLSAADRRRLAEAMAERVVHAAHDLPVFIISDDEDVTRWAGRRNVEIVAPGVSGLNESVTVAVRLLAANLPPEGRIIIAHADLPRAEDLRIVTGAGIAIAPDTARDGSNVLSLPARTEFTFRYGPGSFDAHRLEAAERGLELTVIDDVSLALDVDDPADLAALAAAESDVRRRD